MTEKMLNVLVLCTGNSARSIVGEAVFNHLGQGRIRAYSAGSQPTGRPNPAAIARLMEAGIDTSAFRSKSWDEFAGAGAPQMDMVITVCSSAAGEACPVWPGAPVRAHWGYPDPAHIPDPAEKAAAFDALYKDFSGRVAELLSHPLEGMSATERRDLLVKLAPVEG
ncbi:arsenate reductase ArsC [Gimibacter soli]|uniref:Arsenate reductase ArsC n=1 Tax=Gimibacter soli TaxID=3024400 RepID=A0AAE9XN06_9PROT|nr:arsenate reductase ArsC [Gimibacter soli]WCL53982.1 arsenate reductase ArsC [Gimibacter soli]